MSYKPKAKDVIRYGNSSHCKDGVAFVRYDNSRKEHYFIDTYWYSGTDSLTYVDLDSAELLFNLNDVRQVKEWEYEKYAKADRFMLNSEHGYRKQYFVKKTAKESLSQQLENAQIKEQEARRAIDSAVSSHQWAVRDVVRLEEKLAQTSI